MTTARRALLPALALLLAACSSTGGATSPPASAGTSTAPSVTRIEVRLTDALKIEPAQFTVQAGVPVTFVVTNTGSSDHEFYLGDEVAQAAHGKKMAAMGGMGHDEPGGIAVKPGVTKELIYTFDEAGTSLAGCHVSGHYDLGMKTTITVAG
ncbi:MAG: copper-binding protein [Chloroflexi bacterium]|nr:copper-binding protein [Chloroflexota bacterium]